MANIGVDIAIVHDGCILLTQREDSAAWCLPGGHVDAGESLAEAAVRECREETGLEVQITHLIGIYSRPGWRRGGHHSIVFGGQVVGGGLRHDPSEVLAIGYFPTNKLPSPLYWGHRTQIADALSGVGGSIVRVHDTKWPFEHVQDHQTLTDVREQSGLSREQFYAQVAAILGPDDARIEVPGQSVV